MKKKNFSKYSKKKQYFKLFDKTILVLLFPSNYVFYFGRFQNFKKSILKPTKILAKNSINLVHSDNFKSAKIYLSPYFQPLWIKNMPILWKI
jgi:hypothetical protein